MPIQRDTPRESVRRTLLYHLEKHVVKSNGLNTLLVLLLMSIKHLRMRRFIIMSMHRNNMAVMLELLLQQSQRFRRMLIAVQSHVRLCDKVLCLPYRRSTKRMELKGPDAFTEVEFLEQFRFRKPHFFRILSCLKDFNGCYLMSNNQPIRLCIGATGKAIRVRADKALMVLLRRLAYPCRWIDLQFILGGSRTELSDTYNYMLELMHLRYSRLTSSLACYRYQFARFAQQLASFGCPFDNLVGMFDGHLVATCRPGGDACVGLNMWDFQTFAGKERLHGLKYQACVLPNGLCVVWGPWRGTAADAAMFYETGALDALAQAQEELGETYCGFGDSAYPIHRHMQRILKAPPEGSLTRLQRRYNALMARFRVLIEDVFGEAHNYFASLTHRHNMRLGSQRCGQMFPVSMLFYNLRTLLYGNQAASYYEGEKMLLEVTVEEYLGLADLF